MKGNLRSVLFIYLLFPLVLNAQESVIPTPYVHGGVVTGYIQTESGKMEMVYPFGLSEGNNYIKVFGANRPSTLWDDSYRQKRYEESLYAAVVLPFFENQLTDDVSGIYRELGSFYGMAGEISSFLSNLPTNYMEQSGYHGALQNFIARNLRSINPKSSRGLTLKATNLEKLSSALNNLELVAIVGEIAFAAAFREALAADFALARLKLLEISVKENLGEHIDPALERAIEAQYLKLVASEGYFGALMVEIGEREEEFKELAAFEVLSLAKKNLLQSLPKYYGKVGIQSATHNYGLTAGFWTISIYITYAEIKALLEQFKYASLAVTTSTLRYYVQGNLDIPDSNHPLYLSIAYLDYMFFDCMEETCSGHLPQFYDLVQSIFGRERSYAECRSYFGGLKRESMEYILNIDKEKQGENKQVRINLALIIDSSGSMSEADPDNIRLNSIKDLILSFPGISAFYIVDFDHKANFINPQNYINRDNQLLFQSLDNIDSNGGTNIGNALDYTSSLYKSGQLDKPDAVVLISDGMGNFNNEHNWYIENNIPVFTISLLGSTNESLMNLIADATNGNYYKAYTEYDILESYLAIYRNFFPVDIIYNSKGKISKEKFEEYEEFYIDPSVKNLSVKLFYNVKPDEIKLIQPSGAVLEVSDYEWISGESFSRVGISEPSPGMWKVGFSGFNSTPEMLFYFLLVSGESGINANYSVEVEDNNTISVYQPPGFTNGLVHLTKQNIAMSTPAGKQIEISNSLEKQTFIPLNNGDGSYKLDVTVFGSTQEGFPFQRFFTKSIFIGDETEDGSPLIREIMGDMVIITDLKHFVEINQPVYFYKSTSNEERLVAKGIVINVTGDTGVIQLTETNELIQPGENYSVVVVNSFKYE